MHSTKP